MYKKWLVALPFCTVIIMAAQTKPVPKKSMENGKKVYETYCLSCHQAEGTGVPSLNPTLVKSAAVLGDKKKLATLIIKGMSGQAINGVTYPNAMAPHDWLSDQEVADVLTYVRNSFGNKAPAVTSAEVKKARQSIVSSQ